MVGEVVADKFTATSATATSTLAGYLSVGAQGTTNAQLSVVKNSTATTKSTEYGANISIEDSGVTTTGVDNTYGMSVSAFRYDSTGGTNNTYGVSSNVLIDDLTSGTSNAYGFNATVGSYNGITFADTSYGLYASVAGQTAYGMKFVLNNASAVGTGYGVSVSPAAVLGIGITTNYGLYVASFSGATTNYGLYLENQGTTATQYAIYSAGATQSYFGGSIGIGTTSPYAKLAVAGAAGGTTHLFSISSSTAAFATSTALYVSSNGNLHVSGGAGESIGYSNTPPSNGLIVSGNVGIGTTSPYAALSIAGSSNINQLVVKGNSTQTADMVQFQKSDGTVYGIFGNTSGGTSDNQGVFTFMDKGLATNTGSGAVVSIHADDEMPYLEKFYNDTVSTTVPVFEYYGDASGNFIMDNPGAHKIYVNTNSNSDQLVLDTTGRIGVGTSSPFAKLSVRGTASEVQMLIKGNVVQLYDLFQIQNSSGTVLFDVDPTGNVGIGTTTPFSKFTVASGNAGVFNGALCVDNGGTAKCYGALTAGTIYADGQSLVASDVAENYPVADMSIEEGDIVMVAESLSAEEETKRQYDRAKLDEQYKDELPSSIAESLDLSVAKADGEDLSRIMGVVSTKPGVLLGDTTGLSLQSSFRPVALSGRVPVKVTLEGGDIKKGDRITLSSTPGVGMKAGSSTYTVGIALESFTESSKKNSDGVGKILVFMNLTWSHLASTDTLATLTGTESSFWSIDESSGRIKFIGALDLNDFDMINVRAIRGSASKWSIDEFGKLTVGEIEAQKVTTGTLCIDDVCIEKDTLRALIEKSGLSATPAPEPPPAPEPAPTPEPAPEPTSEPTSTPAPVPAPEQASAPEPAPTPVADPVTEPIIASEPEPVPAPEPPPVSEPAPPAPEPTLTPEPASTPAL